MTVLSTGDASNFTCDIPFSNSITEMEGTPLGEGRVLLAREVAVRESVVCQGAYVLTSDDINARETISIASVWAADEFDKEVSDSATTTTSLHQVRRAGRRQKPSASVCTEDYRFPIILINRAAFVFRL